MIYSISNFKNSTRSNARIVSSASKEMTLHEARIELMRLARAGLVTDATVIRRNTYSGECVGFYSAWLNDVSPMSGANDRERNQLGRTLS